MSSRYLVAVTLAAIAILSSTLLCAEEAGVLALKTATPPTGTTVASLLDPNAPLWREAPEQPLRFNRTPPLYAGEEPDDGQRPTASARLLRFEEDVVVLCIRWADATNNRVSLPVTYRDVGDEHVYTQHTARTDEFADAFCAMVPKERGPHASYPSMMMGDENEPVDLYYWRAGLGFEYIEAHGRATVTAASQAGGAKKPAVEGNALRTADGWSVVTAIPKLSVNTPISFAIWDGGKGHRDGVKFFSLWYEAQ